MNNLITIFISFVVLLSGCASNISKDGGEQKNDNKLELLSSILEGDIDEVKILINEGADVNAKDWRGSPALVVAAERKLEGIVGVLLSNGANVFAEDRYGKTAFIVAMEKDYNNIAELLEKKENVVNAALLLASLEGNIPLMKKLLGEGAYANVRDLRSWTVLMVAAERGHEDAVKLLLAKGARVLLKDKYGQTAFIKASKKGHGRIAKLLKKRENIINLSILNAASKGKNRRLLKLLDEGADVNARDAHGTTPLIRATREKHKDTVVLLVKRSANINARDEYGMTALTWAETLQYMEIYKFLLGANTEKQ